MVSIFWFIPGLLFVVSYIYVVIRDVVEDWRYRNPPCVRKPHWDNFYGKGNHRY